MKAKKVDYPRLPIDIKNDFLKKVKKAYPASFKYFINATIGIKNPYCYCMSPHVKNEDGETKMFAGLWLIFVNPAKIGKQLEKFMIKAKECHHKIECVSSVKEAMLIYEVYNSVLP